jgi:hypothetical protein
MEQPLEHGAPLAGAPLAAAAQQVEPVPYVEPVQQLPPELPPSAAGARLPRQHNFVDIGGYQCIVLDPQLTQELNRKVAKSGRKVESMRMAWEDACAKVEQLQKTSANAMTRKGAANFHKLFSYIILVRALPEEHQHEAVAVAVGCACGEIALNTSNLSVLSGTHHKPGRCPEITEVRARRAGPRCRCPGGGAPPRLPARCPRQHPRRAPTPRRPAAPRPQEPPRKKVKLQPREPKGGELDASTAASAGESTGAAAAAAASARLGGWRRRCMCDRAAARLDPGSPRSRRQPTPVPPAMQVTRRTTAGARSAGSARSRRAWPLAAVVACWARTAAARPTPMLRRRPR